MTLVDGHLDEAKISLVLRYAEVLAVRGDYLRQLAEAGRGRLDWVKMDMMRQNIRSIAGLTWNPDDVISTFLPYSGTGADLELSRRYDGLGTLPAGSFGRAFWAHFKKNGYPFPGEKNGLNEKFTTPHDSTHVLSGYDTSPHGELLVSTFTAAMHKKEPMSGHILPVIFSWHLGIQLQRCSQERDGGFRPARLLAGMGARLRDHRGHLRAAMEFLGSCARAGGHTTPALRDSASRSRRGRHLGPPGALMRGIRRHGDVRCQHHDADISTHLERSAPASRPFRRDQAGLPVRNHLSSPLERLSRHGTPRASHTGPQVSFS